MIIKFKQGYQVISSYSGIPISGVYPERETAEKHNESYLARAKEYYNESVIKEFKKCSEAAEEKSNGLAQYMLGLCYYEGKGVTKDLNTAVELFEAAADLRVLKAQYYLGLCFDEYQWPGYNRRMAFKWFKSAAERGYPAAQYKMARFYLYGNQTLQIEKDPEEEARWYQLAAENGYAEAQHRLGYCYAYGSGTIKDVNKALEWWSKASKQGHYYAVEALCELCEREDLELDPKLVFEGYKLAALSGDRNAAFDLAECYHHGFGTGCSYDESVKWKMIAAHRGHQFACFDLGLMYMEGDIVDKDYSESMRYLNKISDSWPAAVYWIGIHHLEGLGVEKNLHEAYSLLYKSAIDNYSIAQYRLGLWYENGDGGDINIKYALEWFRMAANRGNEKAQYKVGLYYANGIGVIQDHKNAYFWLYIAFKSEHDEAKSKMSSVAKHLTTAQKEEIRVAANQWMKELADEELI